MTTSIARINPRTDIGRYTIVTENGDRYDIMSGADQDGKVGLWHPTRFPERVYAYVGGTDVEYPGRPTIDVGRQAHFGVAGLENFLTPRICTILPASPDDVTAVIPL